ncbi:NAD-dependent epimerase/dehydratase family protein [Streptomyces sp. 7N604]|uniref:NAD-dependent epimerase/dehydratase family protein n=1 Tax=Streptomyces sp. 7N604 TaxID=3457415 RepID=UPI003FCF1BB0
MKVFVTGGSGYIGRSLLRVLVERGDEVTALVRSEESAKVVGELGATPVRGQLTDADVLRSSAAAADGVIHLALTGDEHSGEVDRIASDALLEGAGSKPYVHTGGAWTWGNTDGAVTEDAPYDPPVITSWRVAGEERVLAAQQQGRHPVVVNPGLVYGHQGGLPASSPGRVHRGAPFRTSVTAAPTGPWCMSMTSPLSMRSRWRLRPAGYTWVSPVRT